MLNQENIMNLPEIVFYTFIAASVVQLCYIWIVFSRVAFGKKKKTSDNAESKKETEPVSVVIAAKNEHHNLLHYLKDVLEQDYPEFEVIVVNDQSTDDSEFYLKSLQPKYPHLKIVNVNNPVNFFRGKKFPLSIGIKSAAHDLLVLTDADCQPSSKHWLKEIAESYTENTKIVLGYGGYFKKKGLLNFLIRYETLITAIKYLSFAKMGLPYMGVGRNLSYRKSLFFEQHGFQSHYKIQSGDDDLFVNQAATKSNTKVIISPDARTLSVPQRSLISWWQQKQRHLTTGKYYHKKHLIMLAINDLSFLIMLITGVFLLTLNFQIIIIISALSLRYISFLLVIKKSMLKVGESKLLLISPLLEILLSVLLPMIAMTNIFYKRDKWK